MTVLRRGRRLAALVALALAGLSIQMLAFPWLAMAARRATIGRWSGLLLKCCGLSLVIEDAGGDPASLQRHADGRMLVANHVSWLDIFAINALVPAAFVAKAEIRRWPLAGWLVTMAGTVFIERGRRHAVRAVIDRLAERIRVGYPVAVFPEATTHAGPGVLPFHANLFEAAISTGTFVVPIVIDYRGGAGGRGEAAHYVGETTFIESLWRILGEQDLSVRLRILAPLPAAGTQRHALARELQGRVSRVLMDAADSGSGTAGDLPAAWR